MLLQSFRSIHATRVSPVPRALQLYSRTLSAVPDVESQPMEAPAVPPPNTLAGKMFKNMADLGMPMALFTGESDTPVRTLYHNRKRFYETTGSETVRLDIPGSPPQVWSRDPNFYSKVLGPLQGSFTNTDVFRKVFGFFFPDAVIVTEGDQWKRVRRVLKKAFDRHALENIIPAAAMKSQQVGEVMLDPAGDGAEHDMMAVTAKMTFDTFHMFSYSWDPNTVGSNENQDLLDSCQILGNCLSSRSFLPIEALWNLPTPGNKAVSKAYNVIRNKTNALIEDRTAKVNATGEAVALLDNMIISSTETASDDGTPGLSANELRDNIGTLFFGAYDTTANTLVFVLSNLAKNQRVQDKLRESLSGFDLSTATTADIDGLEYLNNVYTETNRLTPVAFAFARSALEDVVIENTLVRKGSVVMVDHSSVARLPEYWDGMTNLDEFEPERYERFTPKKTTSLPFGFGGRVCIGKRIADIELKVMLIHFVQNYRWSVDPQYMDDDEITFSIAMGKKNALMRCHKL